MPERRGISRQRRSPGHSAHAAGDGSSRPSRRFAGVTMAAELSAAELAPTIYETRQRTLDLVADLTDEEMLGPKLRIVNPPLWEIGHVAWFQEHWVLRKVRRQPLIRSDADRLYDSMAVAHDTRWELALPSRRVTEAYLCEVRDRVIQGLPAAVEGDELYFNLLALFHEDMHDEAFTYTRQTHGYPPPP